MKQGPEIHWHELSILCSRYNSEDDFFDSSDIQTVRQREFGRLRQVIEGRLHRITPQGRFEGWLALYQPASPGVQHVRPVISREEAEPHREHCEELVRSALDFASREIGVNADWKEALSRKLAYKISNPNSWERAKVGTTLLALLKYQREFLVEVFPDWYIQGRGDDRIHMGLTTTEQILQAGRTAPEAVDDWLGPNFGGLLDGIDGRYDLGIDPQFE